MFLEHLEQTYLVDCLGKASLTFSLMPDDLHQRIVEMVWNLRMLRMMLSQEKFRKRGRIEGRQAPTTPRDASTIGQYNVGVKMSVSD